LGSKYAEDRTVEMRKFLLRTTAFVAVAVASGLTVSPASAGTLHSQAVEFTVGSNAPTTSLVLQGSAGAHGDIAPTAVSFNQFDTNQGTLTSVMVFEDLTAKWHGTVGAATGSGAAGTHTIQVTAESDIVIASGLRTNALDGTGVVTIGLVSHPNVVTPLGAQQAMSVTQLTTSAATPALKPFTMPGTHHHYDITINSPTPAFEHAGGGNTSLTINSLSQYFAPNGFAFGDPTATLTLAMHATYNFLTNGTTTTHSTPEPASAFMLGAGVIALSAARRRQKRKTSPSGA